MLVSVEMGGTALRDALLPFWSHFIGVTQTKSGKEWLFGVIAERWHYSQDHKQMAHLICNYFSADTFFNISLLNK